MTITFNKLKARLMANPKVKAEYEALVPEFEIATELMKARRRAGLSQAALAERMGTSQSTIARLESGQTLPTTKTLLRFAKALAPKFKYGFLQHDRHQTAARIESLGPHTSMVTFPSATVAG